MDLLRMFKGGQVEAKGSAAGAQVVALELDQCIARGWGRMATVGAFSTPITGGGAGTIIDLDQPEVVVAVPAKYVMIPIRIAVQCQAPALAAANEEIEILIMGDRDSLWPADGTFTDESRSIFNMRTDINYGAACRLASAFTADMTANGTRDPGDASFSFELARKVKVADLKTSVGVLWVELDLLYEPKHPPILVGPSNLYIYWGGTAAVTGYAQVSWVEAQEEQIFL